MDAHGATSATVLLLSLVLWSIDGGWSIINEKNKHLTCKFGVSDEMLMTATQIRPANDSAKPTIDSYLLSPYKYRDERQQTISLFLC